MASLSDVVKGIQSTNDLLVENVKGQNRTAAMITAFVTGQQSSFGDKLEAGREKGKSKISTRATAVPKGGSKSNLMSGSGLSGLLKGAGGLLAFGGALISTLLGGAAGASLLASIGTLATKAFGKLIKGALLIGIISKFGEGLIKKLFDKLDPNSQTIDDADKKLFAKNITKALVVGVAVGMFGKTLGIAAFFASLVASSIEGKMTTEQKAAFKADILKGLGDKWGVTFSKKNLLQVGTFIAGLLTLKMIKGALSVALLGKAVPGAGKGTGKFGRIFRLGFLGRFAAASIITALGETLGNAVTNASSSMFAGEAVEFAASGAALALLLGLGPQGILAMAIVGVAAAAVMALGRWMQGQRKDYADELTRQTNELTKEFKGKTDAEIERLLLEKDIAFQKKLAATVSSQTTGGVSGDDERKTKVLNILKNSSDAVIRRNAEALLLQQRAKKGELGLPSILEHLLSTKTFGVAGTDTFDVDKSSGQKATGTTAMLRMDELAKTIANNFGIEAKELLNIPENNALIFELLNKALQTRDANLKAGGERTDNNTLITQVVGSNTLRTLDVPVN